MSAIHFKKIFVVVILLLLWKNEIQSKRLHRNLQLTSGGTDIQLDKKEVYANSFQITITNIPEGSYSNAYVLLGNNEDVKFEGNVNVNENDIRSLTIQGTNMGNDILKGNQEVTDFIILEYYDEQKGNVNTRYENVTIKFKANAIDESIVFKGLSENENECLACTQTFTVEFALPKETYAYEIIKRNGKQDIFSAKTLLEGSGQISIENDIASTGNTIILLIYDEDRLIHITPQLQIIDPSQLRFNFNKQIFIPSNTIEQQLQIEFDDTDPVLIQCIQEVKLKPQTNALETIYSLNKNTNEPNVYEISTYFKELIPEKYSLTYKILGQEHSSGSNSFYIGPFTDLFNFAWTTPKNECASISEDIEFKISNSEVVQEQIKFKPLIFQDNKLIQKGSFSYYNGNIYTLSLGSLNLLPGKACVKLFDIKESNNNYNLPLIEKCIDISSFDFLYKEYLYTPINNILLSNVVCKLEKEFSLKPTNGDGAPIQLNCSFNNNAFLCTNTSEIEANEYEIYYDDKETKKTLTIYSNTTSEDNTDFPFEIIMPSNIIYNEENIIKIKAKDNTRSNKLDSIKEICVKQNHNLVTIYGKETDDNYTEHFKKNTEQNCIELRLKIVPSTNYEIYQIIYDFTIHHFISNEHVFGHYFGISRKYFFTTPSNQQINLLFNSYSELKDNINNIFYQKVGSSEKYLANCIENSNDITSTTLTCNVPINIQKTENIEFGIGKEMISKQTIYTIKVTNETNSCVSYALTNQIINLKIESATELKYKCYIHNKAYEGNTSSNPFKLDISNIQPGEYAISCSFEDDIIRYEIPDIKAKIVPKITITDFSTDELYYLDSSQEFIIYFDYYLSSNSIEEIQFNNKMTFKPEPFDGLYNSLRFKCNFLSYFDGDTDIYKEMPATIELKNECGVFEQVTLPKQIKFLYNQIKEVRPSSAINNEAAFIPFIVEFYYNFFDENLIPKTIFLIPQKEGELLDDDIKELELKPIYYNNQRQFELSSPFKSYGVYNVSFSYSSEDNAYATANPSPKINLFLFQYDIEITPDSTDRLVGKEITQVKIPLAHPIQIIQIKQITLLTPITYPYEEEITVFDLNKDNNEIIIQHNIKLSLTGSYVFTIIDYNNRVHTYTINATIVESINNAKINVIKYAPNLQLENHILFSSTNYDVYRITHIIFKKIDSILDPDGNDAEIITFEKQELERNLTQGGKKLYIEASSDSSIRVTLKINENEKYHTLFKLHSVKESSIGEYVFPENDENYIIKDYDIKQRVIFYNELHEDVNKKEINITIDFIVDSIAKQFVNINPSHFTFEYSTNDINTVSCYSNKAILTCVLTFNKEITEPDVLKVSFTNSATEIAKEIHLVEIDNDNNKQCRLINEESNESVTFTLRTKREVPGLKLFINETSHPEIDLFTHPHKENTTISIKMDLLPATGSPSIHVGTSNESKSESIIINLINESIISVIGTLTAQVKEDQFIKFVFNDLARNVSNIYISNNKGLIITPSICIQDDVTKKEIKCTFNLSSLKQDGDYNIYYTIDECGEFSPAQLYVKVLKPPINLIGVTPKYMKLDVLKDISIELSFAFTFYENEQFLKKIYLTDINTNYIHEVALKQTSSNNKIYFSIDNTTNLETGQYNISLDFTSNNNQIKVTSDKTILIYDNSLVLSFPSFITKWVGDNLNTVIIPIDYPVLPEQIVSIKIDSIKIDKSDFILNDDNITITKGETFDRPGKKEIKIEDIAGIRHIFTININDNENLSQAEFEYDYHLPGIENQLNQITITSHNYRMNQLKEIHFNKEYNGVSSNDKLIIKSAKIVNNDSTNSISFTIELKEKEKYILSAIVDNNYERNMLSYDVILTGYHVVKDFFIISSTSSYVEPQLEFYDQSTAKIKKNSIYFNNLSTPAECAINTNKPEIVVCKFYLNSLSSNEKTNPRNFDVTLNTNSGNSITMQLITYETSYHCQTLSSKIEKVQISLTEQIMTSSTSLNVYIGNQLSYIKSITSLSTDHRKTTYEFEIPSSYVINTDLPVKVERSGTSQYEYISDLYVTVIPSGTITQVVMPYLFYTYEKEKDIQVQFDISFHENDIQGLYLTPYTTTNNLNSIILTQCNFINAVQNGIIYRCSINMQVNNSPGKYYISYINKCGKISAVNDSITITFIDAPNFLMSLSPQSVKLNEISQTVFTATYYNSLSSNNNSPATPYDIVFTNHKGVSLENDLHIDKSSITTDKNKLQFKLASDVSRYDIGLFNVKSMFINGYYDISELTVLVYENEIELESTSSEYNLGHELSEIKLTLKYPIFTDQIKNITLIPESQPHNTMLLSFGLFIDQVITSSKILYVNFQPNKLVIDDNYIITIYTNKDYLTKVEYHLKYKGKFEYELKQDVYFINTNTEHINIIVDVLYPGFINESKENFYIKNDYFSNNDLTLLTCEPNSQSTTELICKYTLPSNIEKGKEITIQYKQENLQSIQQSIYLVYYDLNDKLLNDLNTNSLSSTTYISLVSPIDLAFYFNENESQIASTTQTYNNKKQYIISYLALKNNLPYEGVFTLYAVKPSEKPITYIPIDNIAYIHLTDKQILNTPSLKSSYDGNQLLTLEFNKELIENEIQSIQIKDSTSHDVIVSSESCSQMLGTNMVTCSIVLQNILNESEFDLAYVALNGRVVNLGKIHIKNEFVIEPEIYDTTSTKPIMIKFLRNIDHNVYDTVNIVLKPTTEDVDDLIPSTINKNNHVNEISFVLDQSILSNDNYDDLYDVILTLSNSNNTQELKLTSQMILYNSLSVVFSFNRKIFTLNSNSNSNIDIILTTESYIYSINGVYRQDTNEQLQKEELISENSNKLYRFTYTLHSHDVLSQMEVQSTDQIEIHFEFETPFTKQYRIPIAQVITIIKSIDNLIEVTGLHECNYYKEKHSITIKTTDTNAYTVGELDAYLVLMENNELNMQTMFKFTLQDTQHSIDEGYVYVLETLSDEQTLNLIGNEYAIIIYESEGSNSNAIQTYSIPDDKVILYKQTGIYFTKLTSYPIIYRSQTQFTFTDVTCQPSFLFDLDIYEDTTMKTSIHFNSFDYDKALSKIIAEFKNSDIKDLDKTVEYTATLKTGAYVANIKISPTIDEALFQVVNTNQNNFPLTKNENVLIGLNSDYYMSKINEITIVNNDNNQKIVYSSTPSEGEEQLYFDKDNNYILFPSLSPSSNYKVTTITDNNNKTVTSNLLINNNLQLNEYFTVDNNIYYISQKSMISIDITPKQHQININDLSLLVNGKNEKCTQTNTNNKITCSFTIEPTPTMVMIQYNVNNVLIYTPIIIMTYIPFTKACTVIGSSNEYETVNITMPRFAYDNYIGKIGLKIGMNVLNVKEDMNSNKDYVSTYAVVGSDLFRESGTNKVSVVYSDTNTVVLEELKVDSIKKVSVNNVSGYLYSGKDNQVLSIHLVNEILEMDKPYIFKLVREDYESNRKIITNSYAVLYKNNVIECAFDIPKSYDGKYVLKYTDLCGNEFTYERYIVINEGTGNVEEEEEEENEENDDDNKENVDSGNSGDDNKEPSIEDNNQHNNSSNTNNNNNTESNTIIDANTLFKVSNSYIDLNNQDNINTINNIVTEIQNGKDIDDIFTANAKENIVPITIETLSSSLKETSSSYNKQKHRTLLYLVGLAIHERSTKLNILKQNRIALQKSKSTNSNRLLSDSTSELFISSINKIISSFKSYYEQTNMQCEDANTYELEQDPFNYILINKWTNRNPSIRNYTSRCFLNKTSAFIDITTIPELYSKTNSVICFFSIELSSLLNNLLLKFDNDISSSKVIFSSFYNPQPSNSKSSPSLLSAKTLNLSNQTYLYLYLPIVNNSINIDLYTQYSKHGINIYNVNDNAFTQLCYITPSEFDYDLTQKYRYNYLYQQETLSIGNNDTCTLDRIDSDSNKVVLKCLMDFSIDGNYYTLVPQRLSSYDTQQLPLKCIGKISSIGKNAAFWIFFMCMLFLIGINALICLFDYKNIIGNMKLRGLCNDGINVAQIQHVKVMNQSSGLHIQDQHENVISQLHKVRDSTIHDHENKIEISSIKTRNASDVSSTKSSTTSINFIDAVKQTITIHPVLSLTPLNHSITSPMMINAHISMFAFLSMFFFSSLYLTENVIEKRIYENASKRNSFAYPVRNDFGIIIAVIVTTFVFTLISRAIALITFTQRNKLVDEVSKSANENEQCNKVNDFNSDKLILIRRFVMCIVCWAMILLYTIYSIGYVGVYHNTQHIWLYTSIWSIIFHWLILSPIYICVISVLKVKQKEKLCYYLTKLSII